MDGKNKIFYFTMRVDGVKTMMGSIVAVDSEFQSKMIATTKEYSKKFTVNNHISFNLDYIAEYRKVKELIYSDGIEESSVSVREKGFVQTITEIMENNDKEVIGIR